MNRKDFGGSEGDLKRRGIVVVLLAALGFWVSLCVIGLAISGS